MDSIPVRFARRDPLATPPRKAYTDDAAYDVAVNETVVIEPQTTRAVGTGVVMEIPVGWYGRIHTRSSPNYMVREGVIDAGYREEIGIIIYNPNRWPIQINCGERVAQLTIHRCVEIDWQEANEHDLSPSERGRRGFGSSGR